MVSWQLLRQSQVVHIRFCKGASWHRNTDQGSLSNAFLPQSRHSGQNLVLRVLARKQLGRAIATLFFLSDLVRVILHRSAASESALFRIRAFRRASAAATLPEAQWHVNTTTVCG